MIETSQRALTARAPHAHRGRRTGRFMLHYFEMCAPMCLGFAVGDLVYLWAADRLGYSDPFVQLPALSVAVVTFSMTAPMAAWMHFRGMPWRAIAEMSSVMSILALALLAGGWLAILPDGDLVLVEHAAMMPAMLIPMFLRLDLYASGRHTAHSSGG